MFWHPWLSGLAHPATPIRMDKSEGSHHLGNNDIHGSTLWMSGIFADIQAH